MFETKNRRFYASFSYKAIFTKLQKYYFLRGFRNFSGQSQNAAPATTFDTVSCLRSPDTAIHGKSTLDTSQNAAPATQVQNAALQSAAPATRKRRACIDTRPKYCTMYPAFLVVTRIHPSKSFFLKSYAEGSKTKMK